MTITSVKHPDKNITLELLTHLIFEDKDEFPESLDTLWDFILQKYKVNETKEHPLFCLYRAPKTISLEISYMNLDRLSGIVEVGYVVSDKNVKVTQKDIEDLRELLSLDDSTQITLNYVNQNSDQKLEILNKEKVGIMNINIVTFEFFDCTLAGVQLKSLGVPLTRDDPSKYSLACVNVNEVYNAFKDNIKTMEVKRYPVADIKNLMI